MTADDQVLAPASADDTTPPAPMPGSDDEWITTPSLTGGEVRRRATRGAILLGGRAVLVRGVGFFANIALARLLAPEDFGALAFGLTLVGVAGFLADAGTGAALIRGHSEIRRRDLQAVLAFQLVVCALAGTVVVAGALAVGRHGFLTAVMALSLPAVAFRAPGAILSERELSYRPLAVVEIVESLAYYAWAIIAVTLGAGAWGVATAVLVRSLVGTATMLALVPKSRMAPRFEWRRVRRFIGFGLSFQAVGLVAVLRDLALNAGTASLKGLADLGIWSLALSLLQAPFMLFDVLWRVSYPAVARMISAGESPGPGLRRALGMVAVISGLFIAGLVGPAPAMVPAVFGAKWQPAVAVLPWAGLGLMIAGPISVASAGYLYAEGLAAEVLRACVATATAWVALALALLPSIGVQAIGIGWLSGACIEAVMLTSAMRRHARLKLSTAVAPAVAAAVVSSSAAWALTTALGPTLASTIVGGITVAVLYLAAEWVFDRERVAQVWRTLVGLARDRRSGQPATA
ncbi:MAG TPA: oligosaccharide flippase family protein [Acidimicrobiales bacterium]|nr:oligosaccharide flippase family protein [Acidimicrobiales bacterium]